MAISKLLMMCVYSVIHVCFAMLLFAGLLFDVTGSYKFPYLLGGSVTILGGCSGFMILFLNAKQNRKKTKEISSDTEMTLHVNVPVLDENSKIGEKDEDKETLSKV